jgi:hypothetical protein
MRVLFERVVIIIKMIVFVVFVGWTSATIEAISPNSASITRFFSCVCVHYFLACTIIVSGYFVWVATVVDCCREARRRCVENIRYIPKRDNGIVQGEYIAHEVA